MTDSGADAPSPSDLLTIEVDREPERIALRPKGELELTTSPILDRAIRDAEAEAEAEAGDSMEVLLDLRGLEFIDSTGIRVLVGAAQRASESGIRLGMLRGSGQVAQVLELANLSTSLPFVD